jgi:hypothetical protein
MYPKFASNINVERLDALIKLVLRLLALSIDGSEKAIFCKPEPSPINLA